MWARVLLHVAIRATAAATLVDLVLVKHHVLARRDQPADAHRAADLQLGEPRAVPADLAHAALAVAVAAHRAARPPHARIASATICAATPLLSAPTRAA